MADNKQISSKSYDNNNLKSVVNNNTLTNNQTINNNNLNSEVVDLNITKSPNKYIMPSGVATGAVITTKVTSGILDVFEHIGDGMVWTGGKAVEGVSYAVAEVAGLFNQETKDSILNWRESAKKWVKEDIEFKSVDAIENEFYNTEFGKSINDASNIKHDSETAEIIEKVSEVASEIALATAATVVTGGAAASTLIGVVGGLGFAAGTGEQAEITYNKTMNATGAQELGITFSGLESAATWYAYGRLGSGLLSIASQVKSVATHGAWTSRFGSSTTIGESIKKVWKTRRKRAFKKYLKSYVKESLTSVDDIVDMSSSVFGIAADSLNNQDMSGKETAGRMVTGVIQSFVINTIIKRPDHVTNSFKVLGDLPIDTLDKRVASLIKTIVKTADAAEDSGVIPLDAYDIGVSISNLVKGGSE